MAGKRLEAFVDRLFLHGPYVVATMARKHGVLIHAIMALSDHWHRGLTDPHHNIVGFRQDC